MITEKVMDQLRVCGDRYNKAVTDLQLLVDNIHEENINIVVQELNNEPPYEEVELPIIKLKISEEKEL